MDKKLTSMTLENYFSFDLAKDIIKYLKNKKIKKVKLIILEELKEKVEKIYTSDEFDSLKYEIQNSLDTDGISFYLEVPEIKTSWEKFVYGVETNSYEKDFRETFSKYETKNESLSFQAISK